MVQKKLKNHIISLIGSFDEPRDQIKGWVQHNGGTWVNNLDQRLQFLIASEKAWNTDPQPAAIQQARSNNKQVVSLEWLKDKFYAEQLSEEEYSWEAMARTKQCPQKSMTNVGQNGKRKHELTAAEEYGDDEVSENGSGVSDEEEEATPSPPKKAKKTIFLGASKEPAGKKGGASMPNPAKKSGKLVGVGKQKAKAPAKAAKPFTGKGGKSIGKFKIAKPTKSSERAAAGSKREQEDKKKAEKARKAMASINFTAEPAILNGSRGRHGDRGRGDPSSNHPDREKRVRFHSLEPEVFRQPPPKKLQPWEVDLPEGYQVALDDAKKMYWAFLVQTSTDNAQHFRLRLLVTAGSPEKKYQVTLRYRGNAKGIDQTLLGPTESLNTARACFIQAYHWLIGKDYDADEEDNVIQTGQGDRQDSPMQDLTNQVIDFSLMPGMPSHDEIKQRRFKDKTGWKVGDGLATKAAAANTGKGKAPAINTDNGKGTAGRSDENCKLADKGKAAGGRAEVIDIDMTGDGDGDDEDED